MSSSPLACPALAALLLLAAFPARGGAGTGAAGELRRLIESRRCGGPARSGGRDDRGELDRFYAARAYAPAWVRGREASPQALALIRALEDADALGLNARDYDAGRWKERLAAIRRPDAGDAETADFDARLTACVMRYAMDAYAGRANPRPPAVLAIGRDRLSLARFVQERLADSSRVEESLAAAEPPFPVYRRTLEAYRKYRRFERAAGAGGRPAALLRRRVEQLRLALERLRWLPRDLAGPPLVVNIPEFRLHVDDDRFHWVFFMNVVVGKSYRRTPVFASEIRGVVFRPFWNVPADIARGEFVPQIRKDPGFLARGRFEVVDKEEGVVSTAAVDQGMLQGLEMGTLSLRQSPGPQNSLGLVKFIMPNAHDVYLHDTPAKELFSKPRRDFSHGCIRVEDPARLAAWILKGEPGWTAERIRAAMEGDKTETVRLSRPVPVLVVYATAVVMEDGEVRFFDDVYGYDRSLEEALSAP